MYWCIDPISGNDGTGSSQATQALAETTPFKTWAAVTWAAGDTYLQQGGTTATEKVTVGASGTAGNEIILDSYGSGVGVINGGAVDTCITSWTRNYLIIRNLRLTNGTNNYAVRGSNITLDNVEIDSAANDGINIDAGVSNGSITVDNCNIHNNGRDGIRCLLSTASVTISNLDIVNNSLKDNGEAALRLTVETGGDGTSGFTGNVSNNTADNNGSYGIQIRGATSSPATKWSTITAIRNVVTNNGTNGGSSGGLSVSAIDGGVFNFNYIDNNYCQGGSLQTINTKNSKFNYNAVKNSLSANLIDGNCVFCDLYNDNNEYLGNWLESPDTTVGVDNSGTCFAIWNATNNTIAGNIMINGKHGVSFGHASDNGNILARNVIFNMSGSGIRQIGANAPAATALASKNNIVSTVDYGINVTNNQTGNLNNCIYNTTTGDYNGQTTTTGDIASDPNLHPQTYELMANSPCIGAGTITGYADYYGEPPLTNSEDMGAINARQGLVPAGLRPATLIPARLKK